jgi:hypothetical protein
MFALTPLAIALQGIGYGTLLASLQGLVAVTIEPEPVDDTAGSLAAVQPRHRPRRWRRLFDVPNPADLLAALEAEDEELLLEAGAL